MDDVLADGARGTQPLAGSGPKALRNTALVLGARVISQLLALVTVILMERHLKPAGTGRFVDVVNVSALVAVLLDLGFSTLFQREAARSPAEISRFLSSLVAARAVFAVAALAIFALVLSLQGKQQYLAAGFVMMLLSSYTGLLRGAFYAVQRLTLEGIAIVLQALVLLVAVVLGVWLGKGVDYFLWAYAASYLVVCAYYLVALDRSRIARVRPALQVRLVLSWLRPSLPFALAFVITTIYFKIDVPILDFFRGDHETGLYGAAYKPFEALLFIPTAMLNVAFPILSVYHVGQANRMPWAVARFFKALFVLGWPITVGTFVLVGGLRPIYVFQASAPALRILSIAIVFMFCNNAFIAALNSIDRQLMFTWAAFGSMVVNVALNVALIPAFGYLGASWATVLTEIALAIMGWSLCARYLAPIDVAGLAWRPLVAGVAMGLVLLFFRDTTGPLVVPVIALGAAVYAAALFLVRGLDAEEMAIVRRTLRRRSA